MGASEYQLRPHHSIPKPDKPLLVVVLDGWGEAKDDQYNAISRAETPCMDSLKKTAPDRWMLLKAHGTAVGLPSDDDMGNSEVAGSPVQQHVPSSYGTRPEGVHMRLAGWVTKPAVTAVS